MEGKHLICTARSRKVALAALAAVTLIAFALAPHIFLIFFTCVLFSVFLAALCRAVERFWSLQRTWSLTLVCGVLLSVAAIAVWLIGPQMAEQFTTLNRQFPRAIQNAEEKINSTQAGQEVLSRLSDMAQSSGGAGTLLKASSFVSSTLSAVVYGFVVLFVGLYLAANPMLYVEEFSKLFPESKRRRIRDLLLQTGTTLRHWLMGRLLLMGTNGIVTATGLAIFGVPLPVTLGIISALLNFVPNFGPIIAAIPAVLIALLESPAKAMEVAAFYFAYQMFDGYVLTPLVQRRTVSLPPALTIMTQVFFGVLFGTVGVLVAVPMAAVGLVIFREVYQQDLVAGE